MKVRGEMMAIQMRRGEYGDFDPGKLIPAEWAVVLSGDPNTQDGRAAYLCFDAGNVKRMVTQEDLQKDIEMAVGDIKDTVVKESIEKVKEDALDSKVDKVTGKGLSTNDYTTEEKNKLADIKDFTGANSMNNGSAGLVPAPDKSMWRSFLCADGTWRDLTLSYDEKNQLLDLNVGDGYSRVPIPTVTATTPGLMTPAMFDKFDNLIENGQTDISGNAGTATKLKTAVTVDGMNFDGSSSISHYAVCYTSGATAEKTVSLSNFKLAVGSRITVRFNYANTVANPTLNVNATGAKPIYYKNSNIPAELIEQYTVLELVYSGSYWYVVGNMNILTKGDSISVECFTAGYVTSMGQEVQFCIPVSTPIVGCSSVKIESATGLQIRQNGNYVYGGNASTLVAASSYRGVINRNMVSVAATMPNTTNAVNNAPCGVHAALKLTFS